MEITRPQINITQTPPPEADVAPRVRPETSVSSETANVPEAQETQEVVSTAEELQSVVREISSVIQNQQREIHFEVSEVSGRTIIQVYDKNTETLIREIPSDEVQRISQAIQDQLETGLLVKLEV